MAIHTQATTHEDPAQEPVERCLPLLAVALRKPLAEFEGYWAELQDDRQFLQELNRSIEGVDEFSGRQFRSAAELRPYRCMLYLFTRAVRPDVFVETGVHNGLGSAFTLLALARNGHGTLHSIDLPSSAPGILDQGNRRMPV